MPSLPPGAREWVESSVRAVGGRVLGVDEPRIRAWSVVARVGTDRGTLWFKANRGGTVYEPALVGLLHEIAPEHVLAPVALDPGRGWSLQPDGGTTLRDAGTGDWPPVLAAYADLQRSTVAHADRLAAAGVPDLRPAVLPDAFAEAVDGSGLDDVARRRLRSIAPAYAEACAELAEGLPATVQHDDLHDNNVLVGDGSTVRFYDWGDACVSHPFTTMLVTLNSQPEERRESMAGAYLASWDGDPGSLQRQLRLAVAVGPVLRSLSWRRALADARPEDEVSDDWRTASDEWLLELFEPSSLGDPPPWA